MEQREDRRISRTRALIRRAFEEMICAPECGRISVSDLAKRAGINRKTFYLHYETIEDLFESVTDEILERYTEEMEKLPRPVSMEDQTRVFFDFYCGQPLYVERILTDPAYSEYCEKLNQKGISRNRARSDAFREYPQQIRSLVTAYSVSSTLALYRQWVADGKKLSVEELTAIACELVARGFDGYLRAAKISRTQSGVHLTATASGQL